MRKKRILTVLLVSMALAALLAGCAEEEIGPAAPLVPAQTDEQPPASEPDESTVPEEPESEEKPELQADVGALLEAYLQTGGDAEKEALFAHPEEAAAEAMRRLLARPKEERDALCSDECEAAVLFRLVEELVQDDPAHWEKELDYSYLWERLAGMFQFYSAHYRMDGADWIAEHAPRGGSMMRAAWEMLPELRLDATACEAPVNYGVLVNARRIFGAVLSGKVQWLADHSFPNAQLWPLEGFSGPETRWTLTQEDSGEVTLTFTSEGENGKTGTLRYAPSEAEKQSLCSGYGRVEYIDADGESVSMTASTFEKPAAELGDESLPVSDAEMTLENGVQMGMDYNTLLELLGTDAAVVPVNTDCLPALEKQGVRYYCSIDESYVRRLSSVSFRFAEDTDLNKTAELPAARGIRLGDSMQSVLARMPDRGVTLNGAEYQAVYGYDHSDMDYAYLQFVANSFYSLALNTVGGQSLHIVFAHADNTVKMMDLFWEIA